MKNKIIGIFVCMLMIAATVLPVVGMSERKIIVQEPFNIGIKWEQLPDNTNNCISICADRGDGITRMVADDFNCTSTGRITKIQIWSRWLYSYASDITMFNLSIWDDVPAGQNQNYSMPGNLLWSKEFSPEQFEGSFYNIYLNRFYWWDPCTGPPSQDTNKVVYLYNFSIGWSDAFQQQGSPNKPVIYWLGVYMKSNTTEFGWASSNMHWNDDAVYYNISESPCWKELRYPDDHPTEKESIDMAFRIITSPCPWEPTIVPISLLRCEARVHFYDPADFINWRIRPEGEGIYYPGKNITFEGVIEHADANETVPIQTGILLGFGPFELTVEVDGVPPVTKKAFMLFFIMFIW